MVPFVGIVLLLTHFLARTRLGRYMYAIGGNPEAARRAGVNVQGVRRLAFVFSGMTAGLAGLIYVSTLGSISTGVDGGTYTLYAVAAPSRRRQPFGGRGKPLHVLLGGLVIGVVYNGLALMGISAAGQFIATAICSWSRRDDALVRRRSESTI